MQPGFLKIEVSSAREGAPVVAARVTITFADGTTTDVVTDASGETPIFTQLAPNVENSLDPEFDGPVYSTVDIEVTALRFRTVIVEGAQIFATVTTVMPISMDPIEIDPADIGENTPMVFDIPPNRINDRIHSGESPPEGISTFILDSVVIPEYVTVHLGRPTETARNVTVSFPQYIKNVCCSEIYSTWPENAIRANIYCQISLTLNRVFTEWYRSRGFDFDITNSTSFDQFFVFGRSIAENVSRIVDEIFKTYIRKGDVLEPFFAEYCNGTTATCPGLKQWGTVTLAQQGLTPLQILRFYYGPTVNLFQATIVKGVPASYPGTPLRLGSTGPSVLIIQTQLARIRQNYPLIPALTADGTYGAATEAAVRAFQRIFNLTSDGVVGSATWYRISYIFVAVTKLAELGSEGIPSGGVPVPPTPSNILRLGDTGSTVRLAQFMLNIAANFYKTLLPIGIDGVFGRLTQSAVRLFQAERRLSVDGVIGPMTWSELYAVYYDVFNSITPVNPQYPGTPLRLGSTGANVSMMQRFLNYIGENFGGIPVLTIDATFGVAMRTAVIAYQNMFGLVADGIIGMLTWNSIVSVYNTLTANV